ncbi:MAG: ATP-binding protein [Oscillospiraceae bacterium]|nr:ATP-binding protein [Oscillospiraceae bacterium]
MSKDDVRKLRFFSKIRTKFALTYFLVIAIVLALMNTFFLTETRDMIFSSKQLFIQGQAQFIASHLEETFDVFTIDEKDRVMAVMAQLDVAGVTYVVITDGDGMVLYDPAGRSELPGFPVDSMERAAEGFDVFHRRFDEGTFFVSAFTPIISRGMAIGTVYVHDEDAEQGSVLIEMQDTLRNISIGVAIFSIVAVALIVWSLMRRVKLILQAIKSVREGQYSYRIEISGGDEMALLGDEFNSLTDRLRETDEARRRFVADASHELKTPLASIRLLSDSILQNEDIERETVKEFIGDIGMEAERLSRTTGKLMTLTRLDSQIVDERIKVDMREVVEATLRMLRPLAESRGLTLTVDLSDNCFVLATDDAMHQVGYNLIENAIKYNKPDGSVAVRLRIEDGSVVFTVDDRGVGIPEEDLPHVFERFYRVDKARSREAGGSGLGLAIVCDTVREFGGNISASNRVGGGVRLQVRFALYKG